MEKNKQAELTYEQFRSEVLRLLDEHIQDKNYINKLEPDIEEHYREEMSVKDVTGCAPDPGGYVLGVLLLYPDL